MGDYAYAWHDNGTIVHTVFWPQLRYNPNPPPFVLSKFNPYHPLSATRWFIEFGLHIFSKVGFGCYCEYRDMKLFR